MIKIDQEEIKTILQKACSTFRDFESNDFNKFKFGERAFTHRLACYLAEGFDKYKELRVDCEYNRRVSAAKRAPGAAKKEIREMLYSAKKIVLENTDLPKDAHYPELFRKLMEEKLSKSQEEIQDHELDHFIEEFEKWGLLAGHLVYPDIIVHQRGIDDNNILVIEAKINETNVELIGHDYLKLRCFTTKGKVEHTENDEKAPTDGFNYQYGLFLNAYYDGNYKTADLLIAGIKDPVPMKDELSRTQPTTTKAGKASDF